MFKKEFHIKSKTSLKSSEKRKFAAIIKEKFAIEEEISFKNEDINLLKIRTFNDELCEIYTIDKVPWLFIVDEMKYYPSVYFIWKYPECLFSFTVHQSVFEKVQGGADVMLPGIIIDGVVTLAKLGKLEKGQPCAVRLPNNKAAVAIGKTNISSLDMLECGLRGKGIQVLHVVGDLLWKLGPCGKIPEIPLESAQQPLPQSDLESLYLNENGVKPPLVEPLLQNEEQILTSQPEEPEPESVTDIFTDFFLLTLKQHLKSFNDYPILASTFQGKYLSPAINEANLGDKISVQKTEFKKFSVFLKHMEKLGVLKIEKQKDVQKIASVDFGNEMFRRITKSAVINQKIKPSSSESITNVRNTDFKEMLSLPTCLLPLVRFYKPEAKKGDAYPAAEIRRMATDYVRKEQLVAAGQPPRVRLDALLAACTNRKIGEEFTWPKFFEYLMAQLNPCYEFNFSDGSSGIKKGKPPVLVIQTVKRAGNKNVILINHAACFNIDCDQLCKDLRVAMAASSTLNTEIHTMATTGPQVIVQGNNVTAVVNLLCQKYNVPKTAIKILV